jgi:hypothetical protein
MGIDSSKSISGGMIGRVEIEIETWMLFLLALQSLPVLVLRLLLGANVLESRPRHQKSKV